MSDAAQAPRARRRTTGRDARPRPARRSGRCSRAAHDLFVERGYGATTIADIAEAAGVSVPTVYAGFGTKADLLRRAIEVAMAGDDDPIPVADRPTHQWVVATDDGPEMLRRYAVACGGDGRPDRPDLRRADRCRRRRPRAGRAAGDVRRPTARRGHGDGRRPARSRGTARRRRARRRPRHRVDGQLAGALRAHAEAGVVDRALRRAWSGTSCSSSSPGPAALPAERHITGCSPVWWRMRSRASAKWCAS